VSDNPTDSIKSALDRFRHGLATPADAETLRLALADHLLNENRQYF
jgi:hypothetical protein